MRRVIITMLVFCIIPTMIWAQLKNKNNPINIKKEIMKPVNNNLMGLSFIDLSKLTMSHSYSLSYASIGGNGISQSLYLNTMRYQISDPLTLKLQWGLRNYPYNSFGNDHPAFKSGLFFSGAEIKYQPSDKVYLKFQYNALPVNGYYGYPYNYRNNFFWDDEN